MRIRFFRRMALSALIVLPHLSVPAVAQDAGSAIREIARIQVDAKQLREAVASRTLTWLTGSSANNDYVSVGRLANYFGFVGLRVSSGHSLTRSVIAQDTLAVLDGRQTDMLVALLDEQKAAFARTRDARYRMNRALEGMLVGEDMSREAFLELGRAYGASEAELGRVIGQRLGEIAVTLTPGQRTALTDIRAAHISGRGQEVDRRRDGLRLSKEDKQELVNLAARLLSWTTGSQAFNDFEVVGKPSQHFGFVSLRIESNHGVRRGDVAKQVWAMLRPDQQQMLEGAVQHDTRTFGDFLAARAQLMRTLEVALSGDVIDAAQVERLGAAVGEIEAGMTWAQAMAMLDVRNSLSEDQSSGLLAMRATYTAGESGALPADPVERGRQLFAQCALCHNPVNGQAIGPDLSGVIGRRIAAEPSFNAYSPALRAFAEAQGVWSEGHLDSFLHAPRSLVPGTFMGFDGFESGQDRAALIAYLKALN